MKPFFIKLLLMLALILSACAAPQSEVENLPQPEILVAESSPSPIPSPTIETMTLTDSLGRSIVLQGVPQRLVSLSPALTESIFALGAGDLLVGRDQSSDFPKEVEQVKSVGDSFADFSAELYISLKPDLVLANESTPAETILGLETLGVAVFVLLDPIDLEGVFSNISTIGTLIGRQESADELLRSLDLRLSAVEIALDGIPERPFVFYELEASDALAPWTPGSGTLLNEILLIAGARNSGDLLEGAWVQLPLDDLIAIDPSIILLGDAAYGVSLETLMARPGWEALAAVQSGRVYAFDDTLISRPGPRLIEAIETIAALVHPDVFE